MLRSRPRSKSLPLKCAPIFPEQALQLHTRVGESKEDIGKNVSNQKTRYAQCRCSKTCLRGCYDIVCCDNNVQNIVRNTTLFLLWYENLDRRHVLWCLPWYLFCVVVVNIILLKLYDLCVRFVCASVTIVWKNQYDALHCKCMDSASCLCVAAVMTLAPPSFGANAGPSDPSCQPGFFTNGSLGVNASWVEFDVCICAREVIEELTTNNYVRQPKNAVSVVSFSLNHARMTQTICARNIRSVIFLVFFRRFPVFRRIAIIRSTSLCSWAKPRTCKISWNTHTSMNCFLWTIFTISMNSLAK